MRIVRGNFFMDSIKDFYFQLTVSGILTDWIFRALSSFVFDEKHVFQISNCILSDLFYLHCNPLQGNYRVELLHREIPVIITGNEFAEYNFLLFWLHFFPLF